MKPSAEPDRDTASARISELVLELVSSSSEERITVGEIADGIRGRAHGLILFVLAIPETIPMVGLSAILGVPIFVIGGYMVVFGSDVPLPRWLRRRSIKRSALEAGIERALPVLRRLERLSRPRWHALVARERAQGIVCLLMAIVLSVPIPGVNLLAAIGVAGIGLGLLQRDGAITAAAVLSSVLALTGAVAVAAGLVALAD